MNAQEVLKYYWGHDDFRKNQLEIIQSVLDGHDTLALLPTGGGKSICFQVPGMMTNGITLVISPLIALMSDQVSNLKDKGISAIEITSAMPWKMIEREYDNIVNGKYKFVYCSPERIHTDRFQTLLQHLNIGILAVDEAHCISQWGHQFRPSYLNIAGIKPNVATIALTASATNQVQEEIITNLEFREGHNTFRSSHKRENLSYNVLNYDDRLQQVLYLIQKYPGTGLIYVRNRRKTKEVAAFLQRHGVMADYFNAGLEPDVKSKKQQWWMENKTAIMVCTNAFGMGIDNPRVRIVIHLAPPDSVEAYYQEAGRAGRDGKPAHVFLFAGKPDTLSLRESFDVQFPEFELLNHVYVALMNHLKIAIASGLHQNYKLNIGQFSDAFNLNTLLVFNAIKRFQSLGLLHFNESTYTASMVMVICTKEALYDFQLRHTQYDALLKVLLRSYGGMFDHLVKVNEFELANRLKWPKDIVVKMLTELNKQNIISYQPKTKDSMVMLNQVRTATLSINHAKLNGEKKKTKVRMEEMIKYFTEEDECRERLILNYFGELNSKPCGKCDHCRREKKLLFTLKNDLIREIKQALAVEREPRWLLSHLNTYSQIEVIDHMRYLMDEGEIIRLLNGKMIWENK